MSLESDVESIAYAIWESLLGLPIDVNGGGGLGTDSPTTCLVHLHGAFQGAVMIECSEALGAVLTAAMLQTEAPPDAAEMTDALGELANVFAGNIKALLAQPSSISLPTVAFGQSYEIGVVGSTEVARVSFVCEGHPLVVTILERSKEPLSG
jgi:chemotaxis protein CheX